MNYESMPARQRTLGGPAGDLRAVFVLMESGLRSATEDPNMLAGLQSRATVRLGFELADTVGSPFGYDDYVTHKWEDIAESRAGSPLLYQFCLDLANLRRTALGPDSSEADRESVGEMFSAIANIFELSARNDPIAVQAQHEISREIRAIRTDEKVDNWLQGIDDE